MALAPQSVGTQASPYGGAPITDWGSLLGAGIGAGASFYGNNQATNALVQGNQNAINTQQATQSQLYGIYGNQTGLGNQADQAIGAQLGINGQAPNYSAFNNSPGFQFAEQQGDQAINRNAAAQGSVYTPDTMAMLSQYNTGYASQNYNNYMGQLIQSAGLGASGNQGLSQGVQGTAANISQAQQNQGANNAGGAANASGIVGNLLSKLPYGQIASGIQGAFSGSGGGSSNSDTTSGVYNGGSFGGGAPLYDQSTGSYPGANTGLPTDGSGYTDWFSETPS